VWEEPLADALTVQALAAEMLAEVFAAVRGAGRVLRRLECIVYFERAAPQVVAIGLARATRVQRHVAELLRQRLERVDLSGGVIALLLRVRETALFRGAQGALFEPAAPEAEEALGALIDRLAGRLGYEAVVRPQLVDDHQPEFAFRQVTVAEAGCMPTPDAGAAPAGRARPLRLLARPWPMRVVALVPAGPPTWLAWGNQEQRVLQALGPERIETAWWRGRDVRRDYFRVTTEAGRVLWVFYALDEGRWYLHGWFV
jgi:protein ImuB